MIYAYCRISSKTQNIERQIRNILNKYPDAKIYQETFTGTTIDRKEWKKLKKILKPEDIIIFDSVSRMSRNAEEGIKEYFELYNKKIHLVFLKEPYIDTDIYQEQLNTNNNIQTHDIDLNDTILKGIREYLERLAIKQIKIAFEQSEKEVNDLKQRTKEGMLSAKLKGRNPGIKNGTKLITKKSIEMKNKIIKLSKDFGGNLKDNEILEILNISRNTYYKYKKELFLK